MTHLHITLNYFYFFSCWCYYYQFSIIFIRYFLKIVFRKMVPKENINSGLTGEGLAICKKVKLSEMHTNWMRKLFSIFNCLGRSCVGSLCKKAQSDL